MTEQEKRLSSIVKECLSGKMAQHMANYMTPIIVEHLLENGIIVPPCRVGDVVYWLDKRASSAKCDGCHYYNPGGFGDSATCMKTEEGQRAPECIERKERVIKDTREICEYISFDFFGDCAFLSREEAEAALKALKEGSQNDA